MGFSVSRNPIDQQQAIDKAAAAAQQNRAEAPSLLDNPQVSARMEEFCVKYCNSKEVNVTQMRDNVQKGEKLEQQIVNCKDTEAVKSMVADIPLEERPEAVKNLMWLLMAKTAASNELYTSGSIRLSDQNNKVETFIHQCGGDAVYMRSSTHMKEYRLHGEKQRGLDLRGMGMPANKRTLLFDKLPDGTLFLKMEEKGVPPFWKKGFREFSNFAEYLGHCGTFLLTRVKKGGIGIKQARKEHVPKDAKRDFEKILQDLGTSIRTDDEAAKSETKKGKAFGLSKMDKILKKKEESIQSSISSGEPANSESPDETEKLLEYQSQIAKFRQDYMQSLLQAESRGYIGKVKGNEVLLPPLGSPVTII